MEPAASTGGAPRPPRLPGHHVHRLLGVGSTAAVWAATAPDGSDVALKVVPTAGADPALGVAAVRREVAALTAIDHPRVVRLREVVATGDAVVLVLDRAVGGSLGALVRARGSLEVAEVAQVLVDLASALADLHARGLVHGDVSPGNVVFDADGTAMLADFGLAAVVDQLLPVLPTGGAGLARDGAGDVGGAGTPVDGAGEGGWRGAAGAYGAAGGHWAGGHRAGAVASSGPRGTPGFADPAATAAGPTPAGDVHGLGASAWYALTGAVPGPAGTRVPLPLLAPEVGPALAEALTAATSPVPGHRPDAARLAEVAAALARAPAHLVPSDPGAPPAELLTHRLRAAAVAAAQEGESAPRWRRLARPALVSLACLAALGGSWALSGVLLHGDDAPGNPMTTQAAQAPATTTPAEPTPAEASAPPAPAPTPVAPPVAPAPPRAPAVDVLADPRAGVSALAEARAAAYTAADASLLADVDVTGSPAEERDAQVVGAMLATGARVRGLGFEVRGAEVVEADPGAGTATVRAEVVTGAYEEVAADGTVRAVPASEPVTSLLRLQRDPDGRWLVADAG